MEKLKTRNEYVGCNGKCRFYVDEIKATSYKDWVFVAKIGDKVVFNDYKYSHTTSRHQWAVRHLMRQLGIKIDIEVNMRQSLDEWSFKNHSLNSLYYTALYSLVEIYTPRKRKVTKEYNRSRINKMKEQIKILKELGAKYSFKEMMRHYRSLKNKRDRKEDFLKTVKQMKKKTYLFEGKPVKVKTRKNDYSWVDLVYINRNHGRYEYVRLDTIKDLQECSLMSTLLG